MTASIERVFVVVPAFNEEASVRKVVQELAASGRTVVVVDDGSSDDTAAEATQGGAKVVRHIINRGQGAALQTGITYCLQAGADVIVTFDGDGQHRASDVGNLIAALEQWQADVAIGSRFLADRSEIPLLRRWLLRTATVFMRFSSGVPLTDAHNGLRAFRRSAAERIRITLDRMAHASEIVDQIHSHGLRVVEVPVVVRYSKDSLRKGQSGLAAFRIAFDYLLKRWFR